MNVRAKFFVSEIKHAGTPGSEPVATVVLSPIFGTYDKKNEEANKTWSKYTPSGKIEMVITNQAAIEAFEIGKAYYVDFTPEE